MPVIYEIDEESRRIRTRCVGNVMFAEVIGHFKTLDEDPAAQPCLDVLLDLTEMTSTPEPEQLRSVAAEIGRLETKLVWGACAIVVVQDALFGMSRMFEVFIQRSFKQTKVFRRTNEAMEWLDGISRGKRARGG